MQNTPFPRRALLPFAILCLLLTRAESAQWPPFLDMPAIPGVASPDHPDFPGLPDPLRFFNFDQGTVDGDPVANASTWHEHRRPEILAMARHYMYGHEPPPPANIQFSVLSVENGIFNGIGSKKTIHGSYGPMGTGGVRITLYLPQVSEPNVPVIAALNAKGIELIEPGGSRSNRWDIEGALEAGVAIATAQVGDFASDGGGYRDAVIEPYAQAGFQGDWRAISAWAWGLSRIIDYLVTDPEIDPHRIAVTGFSRRGKAALWAGALDDRIALTIPHQSGHGGAHSSRPIWGDYYNGNQFPHWFLPEYSEPSGKEYDRLPFDQHFIVAAIAPRRVLLSENKTYGDNYEGLLAIQAGARPVWNFLGADPDTGLVLEWDTDPTHQHRPYHWAIMYDAVKALPKGGADGFQQWAVEQGHLNEEANRAEVRAAMQSRSPSGVSLLEQYFMDAPPSAAVSDFPIRISSSGPHRHLSLPFRPDSSGIPGRGSHWRGIEQWMETSPDPHGTWVPVAFDDLRLIEEQGGTAANASRLLMEDRRELPHGRTFYRLRYSVRGEDKAPRVLRHPGDTTVSEGETVTLVAHISGRPVSHLQWRKNGVPIPDASSSFLTLPDVTPDDTGFYSMAFGDGSTQVITRMAAVNVLPDTSAPRVTSVEIISDSFIRVDFNTSLQAGTDSMGAENPANYHLAPSSTVQQATLQQDRQSVLLEVDPLLLGQTYELSVDPINSAASVPVASSQQTLVLAHTVVARINFQPESSTPPPGWLTDSGEPFGSRGNQFSYGWTGPTGSARARDNDASPNVLYDTLIHTGSADYTDDPDWKIALPNGQYLLRLVVGDPTYYDNNTYSLLTGDTSIISGNTSRDQRWLESFTTVTVEDGFLEISQGPTARRNKLNFLEIHFAP